MIRRLKKRKATVWYVLALSLMLVLIRWVIGYYARDRLAAPAGLRDGQYRVEKVVDPITFVVCSRETGSRPFRMRLAGIRLVDPVADRDVADALQTTKDFLCRNRQGEPHTAPPGQLENWVTLRFDRTYLSPDRTALGYLLVGDKILNVELARTGWVIPDPIVGNSPSVQRKIRQAAEQAGDLESGLPVGDPD